MKRLIALLLTALCVLALTACGIVPAAFVAIVLNVLLPKDDKAE